MKNTTLMISRNHILYGAIFQTNKKLKLTDIFPHDGVSVPTLIRATSADKATHNKLNLGFVKLENFPTLKTFINTFWDRYTYTVVYLCYLCVGICLMKIIYHFI